LLLNLAYAIRYRLKPLFQLARQRIHQMVKATNDFNNKINRPAALKRLGVWRQNNL